MAEGGMHHRLAFFVFFVSVVGIRHLTLPGRHARFYPALERTEGLARVADGRGDLAELGHRPYIMGGIVVAGRAKHRNSIARCVIFYRRHKKSSPYSDDRVRGCNAIEPSRV